MSLAQSLAKKCTHFNGLMNDTCLAGVKYADVRAESGPFEERFPCFVDGPRSCALAHFLTTEEAEAKAAQIEAESRARREMTASDAPAHHFFVCLRCEAHPRFDAGAFRAHAQEVHGLTELRGTKRMTSHMDATAWHQTDYEWEIDGAPLCVESVRMQRRGTDKQAWKRR